MSKTERQATVESLTELLKGSPNVYVTDFTGLNVLRMTELRRRLRGAGVDYVVVKNTLAQRAFAANGVHALDEHLAGPTGLVLSGTDAMAGAKVLTDFAKEFEKPAIKIGLVDGRPVTPAQVKRLADLPPREVLLAQLAGYIQAPMAQFAGVMNGLLYQMVGALEALRAQRSAAS
jgi:large subunit ribosomal protein L10